MSLFLVDPIDELTQIDLTSTRQLALVASSLTQCLSEKHSDKRQSPRLPLVAPVVPVVAVGWKPTILVVDDSSMNRKVNAFFNYSLSQFSIISYRSPSHTQKRYYSDARS